MKKHLISLAFAAIACAGSFQAKAGIEAMSPQPKQMTAGTGTYTLPENLTIGYTADMPELMVAEITKFANSLKTSTGINVTAAPGTGDITVSTNAALGAEAYNLAVTPAGVTIDAATDAGLYYAFQTVKKLMPANVTLGVPDATVTTWELPEVTINDEPRFEYRGFMLDVSRHFFDADEVKKMMDIMAIYKLNRFHWHLTDDQGWRLPVAKWPKLTVEGATNKNIQRSDFENGAGGRQWRDGANVIYGPYAYTAEEIKDVVAYAKERHIEVIPEIDMPGHMVAAIHAYPELSTSDSYNHEIWNTGGVSQDVLDVSNPTVIQFVKDVVDALAEYFPYETIHLGGDECPTTAWENSASCKALKTEKGYSSFTQLQSNFFKEIADYAKTEHGKNVCAWNEIITNSGADMNVVNSVKPLIFCWTGGADKAQNNGLKHIYTGFNGGYYINRAYAGIDKIGAGKDGSLRATLTTNPPSTQLCIGVQGTFWCEHVDRPEDLEYLALPRLMGIAEQGWSPIVNKDADEVTARLANDIALLELGGYGYGAHQLIEPEYRKPQPDTWYTLSSDCTDDRTGLAVTLVDGTLQGVTLTGDDNQKFKFIENPNKEGEYAIICKAQPTGSVNIAPTQIALAGRWNYSEGIHYGFNLDKHYYGEIGDEGFRYAISSTQSSGQWMNFSRTGQNHAINVYTNPDDGNGGHMVFTPVETDGEPADVPEANVYYRLHTRFNGPETQDRFGSVIELMRDASKGNNCQEDRLWSNAPAEKEADNYKYQLFKFEADPEGSGYYAMVCMAKPQGSVNAMPAFATNNNTARWDYDNTTKHYGFTLVAEHQGTDDAGNFYSAITSKHATNGWYMNTAAAGQGFAIHLWNNPEDQNAGLYTFMPMERDEQSSIEAIPAAAPANVIFDLQGRRLSAPVRGINIINGRKILVK